jgi:murein DD-endopeptidase MepM/ murein hydrolase activator NlpD
MLDDVARAAAIGIAPLETMLARTGVDVDAMLAALRREAAAAISGDVELGPARPGAAGGPFIPADGSPDAAIAPPSLTRRAAAVTQELDRLALLTAAAHRLPFAIPVRNPRFTSGFGVRRDPLNGRRSRHEGLDMAGPVGTPIYSPGEGVAVFVGWRNGYGRVIEVDHGFGVRTIYAHLRRFHIEKGARVTAGQRIADMGSSGRSTGSHLHYEIRVQGRPVDPKRFIEAARHVL